MSEGKKIPRKVCEEFDGTCEELKGALSEGREQAAFGLFFRLEGIRDALVIMGKDVYWLDKAFKKRIGNKHPELLDRGRARTFTRRTTSDMTSTSEIGTTSRDRTAE